MSKQLMPSYDKPLIYCPLSILMLAGLTEILVITTPQDQYQFQGLLSDGSQWGIKIRHAVQPGPDGLAQAFIIGRDFIGTDPCSLILGDNIFFGHGLTEKLRAAAAPKDGATVFGYWVKDPQHYGVAEFDANAIFRKGSPTAFASPVKRRCLPMSAPIFIIPRPKATSLGMIQISALPGLPLSPCYLKETGTTLGSKSVQRGGCRNMEAYPNDLLTVAAHDAHRQKRAGRLGSVLSNAKFQNPFGVALLGWEQGLKSAFEMDQDE